MKHAVIQFLTREPNGKFDLAGEAVTHCPQCGLKLHASGYYMACANALYKHLSLEHGINISFLPPTKDNPR